MAQPPTRNSPLEITVYEKVMHLSQRFIQVHPPWGISWDYGRVVFSVSNSTGWKVPRDDLPSDFNLRDG